MFKTFFHAIGAQIMALLGTHFSNLQNLAGWESITEALINALEKAKTLGSSAVAVTVASLVGNGLGTVILTDVEKLLGDAIPTLEIFLGGEKAIEGLTGTARADAAIQYAITAINKLPADMQGKHWEDIARKFLELALGVTTTEAKVMVNFKLGQMKIAATQNPANGGQTTSL